MLIEKYMEVEVQLQDPDDEYGSKTFYEEVEVNNSDIRHYIDTYLSAEDVLNYAKQIAPEEFTGEDAANLDFAYDVYEYYKEIWDKYEHDDIEDIRDLNEYIQDCVQNDYEDEAADAVLDQIADDRSDEGHRYWGL